MKYSMKVNKYCYNCGGFIYGYEEKHSKEKEQKHILDGHLLVKKFTKENFFKAEKFVKNI